MFHPSFTYTHGLQTVMILGGLLKIKSRRVASRQKKFLKLTKKDGLHMET